MIFSFLAKFFGKTPEVLVQEETPIKYAILAHDTRRIHGKTVYRIIALNTFKTRQGLVHKDDLGGYVQKENNLNQYGKCWIFDEAVVMEDAEVMEDATVSGKAIVRGRASIQDMSVVTDNARVNDSVMVTGISRISGNAVLQQSANIEDCCIRNNCKVGGYAMLSKCGLFDDAKVFGFCHVSNVTLRKKAKIVGVNDKELLSITGGITIGRYALIKSDEDFMTLAPVGPRGLTMACFKDSNSGVAFSYGTECFTENDFNIFLINAYPDPTQKEKVKDMRNMIEFMAKRVSANKE